MLQSMEETPKTHTRVQIAAHVPAQLVRKIDESAEAESRSRSSMIEVLIRTGLEVRSEV